ncbi:MAG: hypothetical protein ACTSR3_20765 [Candidatus Helarchaeota archaeon]
MVNCVDCKFFGGKNDDGQIWCDKKQIYVGETSKETCPDYEKK